MKTRPGTHSGTRSGTHTAILALLLAANATPAMGDSLTGSSRFTCSALESSVCSPEGECASGLPWDLNVPQFLLVDLERNTLSTTEASGEQRSTPILQQTREDGHLFLQGVEQGRAYSLVLKEDSGHATVAIALDGLTIGVFGACTPGLPR